MSRSVTGRLGAGESRAKTDDVAAAIAELDGLDDAGLWRRWRAVMSRPLPDGLGRSLTIRVLAYQLQARRYGDLDRASALKLAKFLGTSDESLSPDRLLGRLDSAHCELLKSARTLLPGAILSREHDGTMHRVMVLKEGFAWNGKTYASLSTLAFAITGTRWNGHRFFGLQDKAKKPKNCRAAAKSVAPSVAPAQTPRPSGKSGHPDGHTAPP